MIQRILSVHLLIRQFAAESVVAYDFLLCVLSVRRDGRGEWGRSEHREVPPRTGLPARVDAGIIWARSRGSCSRRRRPYYVGFPHSLGCCRRPDTTELCSKFFLSFRGFFLVLTAYTGQFYMKNSSAWRRSNNNIIFFFCKFLDN